MFIANFKSILKFVEFELSICVPFEVLSRISYFSLTNIFKYFYFIYVRQHHLDFFLFFKYFKYPKHVFSVSLLVTLLLRPRNAENIFYVDHISEEKAGLGSFLLISLKLLSHSIFMYLNLYLIFPSPTPSPLG